MSRDEFGAAAPPTPQLPEPAEAARAFAEIKPELDALRSSEVRPVTVEVPFAVTIALGAQPRVLALRDPIIAQFKEPPLASIERLPTYAMGAYYAHLLTLPAPKTAAEKTLLLDEARPLRKSLLVGAEALADRGLVDAELVAKIRSGAGNLDVAGDLIALGSLFTSAWPRVESKTAVTLEEVERSGSLGATLLMALSRETLPPLKEATPGEIRARAFTLLVRAYDECRRVIGFLRYHEGDADEITPSLFTRRARAKKAAAPEAAES